MHRLFLIQASNFDFLMEFQKKIVILWENICIWKYKYTQNTRFLNWAILIKKSLDTHEKLKFS